MTTTGKQLFTTLTSDGTLTVEIANFENYGVQQTLRTPTYQQHDAPRRYAHSGFGIAQKNEKKRPRQRGAIRYVHRRFRDDGRKGDVTTTSSETKK